MKAEDAPTKILVFDTETSGVETENDRILTCYAMLQNRDGTIERDWSWILDPGIEVPKGASDVHGMTTEYIRENGRKDVTAAIWEIYSVLRKATESDVPIVAYNLPYDLTILDRELRRSGFKGGCNPIVENGVFFDVLVHDRAVNKYVKGNKKLMTVAARYGIEIDESKLHEASYDVYVTGKLTWRVLQRDIEGRLAKMQGQLVEWAKAWAEHTEEYFRTSGRRNEDGSEIKLDGSFPMKPYVGGGNT